MKKSDPRRVQPTKRLRVFSFSKRADRLLLCQRNLLHPLIVTVRQIVAEEGDLELSRMVVGQEVVRRQQHVERGRGAHGGRAHVHDEDRAALHRAVVFVRQAMQDADEGFEGDGVVVLRAAAAVDNVIEAVMQNARDARAAHGERRRAQDARQGVSPRRQAHVAHGQRELLVGGAHVEFVSLLVHNSLVPAVLVLHAHGRVRVRMTADLVAIRHDSTHEIRIVVDVLRDDEERAVHAVLVQDGKQMVDGIVASPVVEGEEHGSRAPS